MSSSSTTWIVSARTPAGDFTEPVEDMVREYLMMMWEETDPELSVNPPHDYSTKVRFGDFDWDGFSTYYIKVKEGTTIIDSDYINAGLFGFQTPVIVDLTARRLKYGEHFDQLDHMRLEVMRIIGHYMPDDISGVSSILLVEPAQSPEKAVAGPSLGQSVWHASVTLNVVYFKNQ